MNILFLTTHLNTGGISSYLYTLTKNLLSRGHRVFIASSGGDLLGDFTQLGAVHLRCPILTKSELDPRIYFSLVRLARFINQHKIDLIHSQTRVTQVMGQILKFWLKKPYLSTCHGYFKPRLSRLLFPCWGDKVIAISQPVFTHLNKDFRVSSDKIILVSHGIDLSLFPRRDEAAKLKNRLQYHLDDRPLIGIIARLSDVKGHDVLISAMPEILKDIPQAKLLIIGEGRRETFLKNQVQRLGLEKQILFYPIVNQTAEMLSILDVFVMPSLQEGLGLSVMEAQACGLPVVASRVGGLPYLIQDGRTGLLVEPNNPKQLAEAVVSLLKDPWKAQRMGMASRGWIEKELSLEKMMTQTIEVYHKIKGHSS